jgi:hypothetical protein
MPRILLPSILAALQQNVIADNLTDSITITRGGVEQDPQSVRVRKVTQSAFDEGEAVGIPAATLEIIGLPTLDIRQGDRFTWDGNEWNVMEFTVMGTDHVTRRATVEVRL